MITEKQFIINNKKFDLKTGIIYLKTTLTSNYDKLSEDFKHEDVKNSWDLYEGIPFKLYEMTKSEDKETLDLAIDLLEKLNITFKFKYNKIYLWDLNI